MDPTVGSILFGGVVLTSVFVLISHACGQAKIEREKKERDRRQADTDKFRRQCEREDVLHELRRKLYAEQQAAAEEYARNEAAKLKRSNHQKTRNVLRAAAEKRKARRLYPSGVIK